MPPNFDVVLVTDSGNIYIELFRDTPAHRQAFIRLAREGVFTGQPFDRVFPGSLLQLNVGKLGMEEYNAGTQPTHRHHYGALGAGPLPAEMLNNRALPTSGMFYIVCGPRVTLGELHQVEDRSDIIYSAQDRSRYLNSGGLPTLDARNIVFGHVVSGMDVVERIAAGAVTHDGHSHNRPLRPVFIRQARVVE
jgi:peptidyl-prolyl cis-trans isomerase B (cyclophilin B)